MTITTRRLFVTIHPSPLTDPNSPLRLGDDVTPPFEHDSECPVRLGADPTIPGLTRNYRVTRPFAYRSPGCPGHLDVSARQGHYTEACCATRAARIITKRLVEQAQFVTSRGDIEGENLDVEVWT